MPCMNFALWVEGSVCIFFAFFPGLTECSKVTTICYLTPPPSPSMHGLQFYAIGGRANFMVCGEKGQQHCTKKKSQVYAFVFLDHSSVCNSTFLWICVSDNSTVLDISAEWKECRLALKEENCWKLKVVVLSLQHLLNGVADTYLSPLLIDFSYFWNPLLLYFCNFQPCNLYVLMGRLIPFSVPICTLLKPHGLAAPSISTLLNVWS